MSSTSLVNRLQEKLKSFPNKEYLLGFTLLVLVTIKFVIVPVNAYLTEKKEGLQQLADTIKSSKLIKVEIEKLQQEQVELRELEEQWRPKFYSNNSARVKLAVVNKLTELGESNELIIISTRWLSASRKPDVDIESLKPLKLSSTIRGEYNKVKNFLLELQNTTPILELSSWRIREGGTAGVVMLKLELQVYYADGEGTKNGN